MIITIDRMVKMVRTAIGHTERTLPLPHCRDPDTITLDSIIRTMLIDAIIDTYSTAPSWMLTEVTRDIGEPYVEWHQIDSHLYRADLLLPEDFLRLTVIQMSDWSQAVHHVHTPGSAYYTAIANPYSGCSGTPIRPACRQSVSAEGRIIELYACTSDDAEIVQAKYLPYPIFDADGGIDIAQQCLNTIIRTTSNMLK